MGRGDAARLVGLCFLAACARGGLLRHEVRPGETLYAIGRTYGVSYQELARANHLADPNRIRAGQLLRIPRRHRRRALSASTHRRGRRSSRRVRRGGGGRFAWPLSGGVVSSGFGPRGGGFHEGVDIGAPLGTPVRAAGPGRVLYSDRLHGYGNVVIIAHRDGYATVYAHNQRNLVRAGEKVRRGQVIARVGRSGRASGPNLHFEVRRDNVARDPLRFLPSSARTGRLPTASRGLRGDVLSGGG